MVSNDYRELILFLMIYQNYQQFSTLLFDQTFLANPNLSTRLIWFPWWLEIDLFVRRREERLTWRRISLARLLMLHDSLRHHPDHCAGDRGLWLVNGAWPIGMGVTGVSDGWRAGQGQPVTMECDLALTRSSHWWVETVETVETAGAGGTHSSRGKRGQISAVLRVRSLSSAHFIFFNDVTPDCQSFFLLIISLSVPCCSPWSGYRPVWRQLSGPWPPPGWLSSLLPPQTDTDLQLEQIKNFSSK